MSLDKVTSQQGFACSNSTMETLQKGKIFLKLTIKTLKQRQKHCSGVFIVIVNFYVLLKYVQEIFLSPIKNTVIHICLTIVNSKMTQLEA